MIPLAATDPRRVALESDNPVAVALLDIGTDPAKKITDAGYDITIGGDTYATEPAFVAASVPEGQAGVGRDLYQLTFADEDPSDPGSYASLFENGTGIPLRVRVAFILEDKTVTDTLEVYRGRCARVDPMPEDESGSESPMLLTHCVFTGPFAKLDDSAPIVTSPADQARRDPDDDCFSFIHRVTKIIWGR